VLVWQPINFMRSDTKIQCIFHQDIPVLCDLIRVFVWTDAQESISP
jgi:hypothetical protein